MWNLIFLKIQYMFLNLKMSKMFYHMYMGYIEYDALNKVLFKIHQNEP